jgi:SAM-dependent methyltransferase
MATLIDVALREAENVWNRYVANRAHGWESMYARGFGEMLDGPGQRARHYVIAGLVSDLAGHAPAVLDVGCGFGTTYAALKRLDPLYHGIDLSGRAIERCRERYAGDACASFEVADFSEWSAPRSFDVVILNEVLQYFPRRRALAIIDKAIAHLYGRDGVLVISCCERLKAWNVRRQLAARKAPAQRIDVATRLFTLLGGRWTVEAYTELKEDPPLDLRGYGRVLS